MFVCFLIFLLLEIKQFKEPYFSWYFSFTFNRRSWNIRCSSIFFAYFMNNILFHFIFAFFFLKNFFFHKYGKQLLFFCFKKNNTLHPHKNVKGINADFSNVFLSDCLDVRFLKKKFLKNRLNKALNVPRSIPKWPLSEDYVWQMTNYGFYLDKWVFGLPPKSDTKMF